MVGRKRLKNVILPDRARFSIARIFKHKIMVVAKFIQGQSVHTRTSEAGSCSGTPDPARPAVIIVVPEAGLAPV
jgi:hypothetical protein